MIKLALTTAAAVTAATTGAFAGIDRSGQDITVLFEEGNYFKFSLASVNPDITSDATGITQSATGYTSFSFGYKQQFNENLSFALIWDQPYGADIKYVDGPAPLPGAYAYVDSTQITGIARYELGNGFSVHGGAFAQKISGEILSSPGLLDASGGTELGGLVGVAYERPEIAMRIALTYFTEVDHELTGTHGVPGPLDATATVSMPAAFNLDFQTGVAQDTLVFGSIRHAKYKDISLDSVSGAGAVTWVTFPDDTTNYEIGVGRRLNDQWSVALTLGYQTGEETGTSFLSPDGARKSIGVGASYTVGATKVSAGLQYSSFDEKVVSGVPFEGDALAAGLSVGVSF